jgi:hypothetical protein
MSKQEDASSTESIEDEQFDVKGEFLVLSGKGQLK